MGIGENFFGQERAKAISQRLLPFMEDTDHIIDVGAGDCRIAEKLMPHVTSVQPIDILGPPSPRLPLTLYNGDTLPYPEHSFDKTVITFVLHHAKDPSHLFEEAQRITKPEGSILVIEDIVEGWIQSALWKAIHNRQHARNPALHEAGTTKSMSEWSDFFIGHGTNPTAIQRFRDIRITCGFYAHGLFVVSNGI